MVEVLSGLLQSVLATFIPLYLGLFISKLYKSNHGAIPLLRAAYCSGILFWFFLDVMNDASLLDVNQGFGGDFTHVVLALSFAVTLIILFGLERFVSSSSYHASNSLNEITYGIAGIVALGIGFHALGEGIGIGAAISTASSIVDAIGGVGPGFAYVLHKLLEGVVLGVFALMAGVLSSRKLGILGLIAGGPTILGLFVGLPSVVESTYFFALGAAGAVYAEFKLVPIVATRGRRYAVVFGVLLGFYSMYLAGLFHG